MAGAVEYFGRILALIGLLWAGLLLLRSVSIAHGISLWRTAGALALTVAVIYLLIPLVGLYFTGYLLAG
jgi:hypothetical protein